MAVIVKSREFFRSGLAKHGSRKFKNLLDGTGQGPDLGGGPACPAVLLAIPVALNEPERGREFVTRPREGVIVGTAFDVALESVGKPLERHVTFGLQDEATAEHVVEVGEVLNTAAVARRHGGDATSCGEL